MAGLASEIHVESFAGSTRYILPRRRLGKTHLLGLVPIIFAIVVLAGVTSTFIRPLLNRGNAGWFEYVAIGLLLLIAWPLLKVVRFGMVLLAGHTRIEVRHDGITVVDRCGPFRYERRRDSVSNIRRVGVNYGDGTARINGKPTKMFREVAGSATLGMQYEDGEKFLLAIGYPKDWLMALGQEMAGRFGAEFVHGTKAELDKLIADDASVE